MSSLRMVHVLGLDVPSRRLSDRYHQLEMQAPLVPNPTNVNLRGNGGVFEHPEGAGFMSESDDTDSENDAISIFSGISTATGGGESDHSDGNQSDILAASVCESCLAEGNVLKQEDDATVSGSQSVGNASSGLPVAKEDSRVAI